MGVKRSRPTTFHIEVSWELIRVALHSGRGSRGDINTLEVGACEEEGGRGRKEGWVPCGDDTICLVVSLSWRSDPDSDTRLQASVWPRVRVSARVVDTSQRCESNPARLLCMRSDSGHVQPNSRRQTRADKKDCSFGRR